VTMRLLSRALRLADRGWYVFPLRPGDKRPLPGFTNWQSRATTDPDQITSGGLLLRTTLALEQVLASCW
jgi:Bifunctional DNA primase/polymerase, N-terminal